MSIHRQILDKARAYRDYTARNLSAMVKIPSFSGKEEEVCKKIKQLCEEAGFDEVRIDGLGSVVGRVGNGPKKVAFDAHIDTVGVGDPDQWHLDPFSGLIRDGRVHGRGSTDQKGGAASMITAGRLLKELNYKGKFSAYFTFTVMEEDCDGMCWKYLIEEEKLVPDYFISTEPTSCRLYRGHRGRMEIVCGLKGVSCHGSAPERGVNVGYKAARAALAMEKLNEDLQPDEGDFLGKGTIVVSQIDVHGPSQCAVPDEGLIYLDRRLTWGEDADLAIRQVKKYMGEDVETVEMPRYTKRGYKNTDYGQELYFPTWKIPADHPLVQTGVGTFQELFGKEPIIDKWTFSTNAVAVCGRHKIPSIGFGPGDEDQAHTPNETNRVDDLEICSAFYALLPYRLDRL